MTVCREVGPVLVIVAKRVAVEVFCVVEVPPHRQHGDAASGDTSSRVGVGAGEIGGIDLRYYRPNVCKVAAFPFKVVLTDSVVLCWEVQQDHVIVLAVRAAPDLHVEKVINVFI